MRFLSTLALIMGFTSLQGCADSPKENSQAISNEVSVDKEIPTDVQTQSDWKTLKDSLYTLIYPGDWELNYTKPGLNFVAISPPENNTDQFRENISLVIQSMKKDNSTLEDFVETNTAQIIDMINNGKLIKNEEGSSSAGKYREVSYSGSQNDMEIMNTQRYYFHDGLAFIFTFSCEKGNYDKFMADGNKLMNSIEFK